MADDGTKGDWDAGISGLQNLIDSFDAINRKALKAAAEAVAPRLAEAAPERIDEKHGGNSLPPGALKAAVRSTVQKDKETGKLQAVVDFGIHTWRAHIVDIGHQPPYSNLAKKVGREVTAKPTPAYPFVRAVQDTQQQVAQAAYAEAMTNGTNKALKGFK